MHRAPGLALLALALIVPFGSRNVASAQPQIGQGGIVNAASFRPASLPGGSIAQGSFFTIFGTGLGPAAPSQQSSFPLTTSFRGVEVTVRQGATSVAAIPHFVWDRQINAIMPSNSPLGEVEIVVSFSGAAALSGGRQQSQPATATVVASSVGVFTFAGGTGPGIFTNNLFQAHSSRRGGGLVGPASQGDFVIAWATGLGGIAGPDNVAPDTTVEDIRDLDFQDDLDLDIFVGNEQVDNVFYAGRSSTNAAVDQLIFQIPDTAPDGCFVPVSFSTDGVPANTTTLAINRTGGECEDAQNPFSTFVIEGGDFGTVLLTRLSGSIALGGPPLPIAIDTGTATFIRQPGGVVAFNPLFSLPPVDSCSSFTARDLDLTGVLEGDVGDVDAGEELDAGESLTITRLSDGTAVEMPGSDGAYTATLGGGLFGPPMPLFLDPGQFRLQGPGGTDVGAFDLTFDLPAGATWTNRDQLDVVNRNNGVTYQWSGGSGNGIAVLVGANVLESGAGATGAFVCLVEDGAGSFTVGPQFLSSIPATTVGESGEPTSLGFLALIGLPDGVLATFNASGLSPDGGVVAFTKFDFRTADFQ